MMSPPFTIEGFLAVFAAYNTAIWPLQIVAYCAGLVVIAALWRKWLLASWIIPVLLRQFIGFFGGTTPTSPAVGHIRLAIANFGLVFFIGGPLGEEFGWRSYAVPALGARMGWRRASLLIGVLWGLWQMPFVVFMLNIIAGSVSFSWLFLRSSGSVIPALVAHTSLDAFAGILSIVPTAETSRPYTLVTGILIFIACWLLIYADTQQTSHIHRQQSS